MQFDKLIQNLLNESKDIVLNPRSNEQIIFVFYIDEDDGLHYYSMKYSSIDDASYFAILNRDAELLKSRNYLQATHTHIKQILKLNSKVSYDELFKGLSNAIQPYKKIKGQWFAGTSSDEDGAYILGFKVDLPYYLMGHILDAGSEGVAEEDNILDW